MSKIIKNHKLQQKVANWVKTSENKFCLIV